MGANKLENYLILVYVLSNVNVQWKLCYKWGWTWKEVSETFIFIISTVLCNKTINYYSLKIILIPSTGENLDLTSKILFKNNMD